MVKVKRALISVSDKTGIVEFAKGLKELGTEIISTGGTAALLKNSGIDVIEVGDYTGFPEMLNGRVKTLHPKIHAGLLALRNNQEHLESLHQHKIGLIDMVVVNLYPFEQTIKKKDIELAEAIENIDIGGPSMLRSAAKNYNSVAVVCNPARYNSILEEMKRQNCLISDNTLAQLGLEVFELTSHYDSAIHKYLKGTLATVPIFDETFPFTLNHSFEKVQDLRYGENPHQKAALYRQEQFRWADNFRQLHGKELSFNNILDLTAALDIVKEFSGPAAVVIKHTNPCGVAQDKTISAAYLAAHKCDPLSAFGGIVGLNKDVDTKTAQYISKSGFLECVIAPSFSKKAQEILKQKKNLRLIEVPDLLREYEDNFDMRKVIGGLLVQEMDKENLDKDSVKVVTKRKPTSSQLQSLLFGWKAIRHTKSNAIMLVRGTRTVGIGPGQTSRVDAVHIAIRKAGKLKNGSCLISDAFFPKPDSIKLAAKAKIKAIIQPGGSIADADIIKEADRCGIAMVFTGIRHFKH
ncbi:MAG: bifunctional phosphoribosylaminoimidazolecarboxamide formyltransferase/IMP cyclohydrolase [Candidatus Omnitrophica bacterium]|nr:bifunctional phosphoribosylaminoimidazolecarboxamide formyltransferase/IMP cyclohydrolase [Candidatus Omnitrophota bacterium]